MRKNTMQSPELSARRLVHSGSNLPDRGEWGGARIGQSNATEPMLDDGRSDVVAV